MSNGKSRPGIVCLLFVLCAFADRGFAEPPAVGPETEQRFPPLVIPAGFKATLFACDPLVEYPSVIAVGPRPGTVFVAHDYLTGLGTDIVRRDEIRLLEDTNGDGYADKSIVFAAEFNSLQGLAFHAGTVFAMHAPLLTALRDTNGDGIADERRDLLTGLGLPPEKNPTRLHCANGVAVGHDGWLYLSIGDNGVDVRRPEQDRLVLNGGGIFRCRSDGRDLHVFSTGLRNIYDITLDEQLNVFVRDNENDGGDYMIRVCHSFHGADHGYPYLYREHPDEALAPLADLGRGSSAGGVCYLETAFPTEYRGNLFFCEWGRAVVRYERKPAGSGFGPTKEVDFAAGATNDPYGFKPTDIIVDRDGSLLISDWGDGQRPKRGRGRIYRITHPTLNEVPQQQLPRDVGELIKQIDSPSYSARVEAQTAIERRGRDGVVDLRTALKNGTLAMLGRSHAVWVLAKVDGREAIDELFEIAEGDPEISVRSQAVRAIADLTDPVLETRKLEAGRGDSRMALQLSRLSSSTDPQTFREIVVALGRLRWSEAPDWMQDHVKNPDASLAHAAIQTLRRCDNWPTVLKLLDGPDETPLRGIALRAMADHSDPIIVDGLTDRLRRADNPRHRQQYAETLARVFKKPAPWVYWGYRPAPRPANTVGWERSENIAGTLNQLLADPDRDVRVVVLQQMQREQIPVQLAALNAWLDQERSENRVDAILGVLAQRPTAEIRDSMIHVIRNPEYAQDNRQRALSTFIGSVSEADAVRLLELARLVEDGPILGKLLLEFGKYPKIDSRPLLLGKLDSPDPDVRASAVTSLSNLRAVEAAGKISLLLKDDSVVVRRAAAIAAGNLNVKESGERLLTLARDGDPATRSASLNSLRLLRDPSAVAVAVAGLDDPATELAALDYVADFGGPEQVTAVMAVASTNRSVDILRSVTAALVAWEAKGGADSPVQRTLQNAIAKVHGDSGLLLHWRALDPQSATAAAQVLEKFSLPTQSIASGWRSLLATGVESQVDFGSKSIEGVDPVWFACSDLFVDEPTRAQFLASSNGTLQVYLNGRSVFDRNKVATFHPDSDRFETELAKGMNRLVVQVSGTRAAQFHVRFRRLGSTAEHERITQYSLQNTGNAERGRELFFNSEKSLCMKCHRLNNQGGQIGPDLTGIGSRYSRIHLIESILEPSRTIAPSYETITVALSSGRIVTGVKVSETDTMLILGDDQGKTHEIPKSAIDERVKQVRSTMPDGLEKRLNDREFLDLLTFLTGLKKGG